MSVRINASGEYLRRTANLPSVLSFTMCGWSKLTDRGTSWQWWGIEDAVASSGDYCLIGWTYGGTFAISCTSSNQDFPSAPSTETWFFWVLACEGSGTGQVHGYWAYPGDTTFKTANATIGSFTVALMSVGNDSWDEYTNGAFDCVKVWDVALTESELWLEMHSRRPVRTANLNVWSPLLYSGDVKDYSGNGRNWTVGGTLTDENSAPVSFNSPILVQFVGGGAPTLTVADAFCTSQADAPVLTQEHNIVVPDSFVTSQADPVILEGSGTLSVLGTFSISQADQATLTQVHNIVVPDSHSTSQADNVVVVTVSILKPNADVTDGNWVNEVGSQTNLYNSVDENTINDSDYIQSDWVVADSPVVMALADGADPLVHTGHIFRYRYQKTTSTSMPTHLSVQLRQGYVSESNLGTLIVEWVHQNVGNSLVTAEQTLTAAQAGLITDYANLYVRMTAYTDTDMLLDVSGTNSRYFVNAKGDPVFLNGFHTWGDVQDGDDTYDPPRVFDWAAYLQALKDYKCNFTKLWTAETANGWSDILNTYWHPPRYERTGPGNDNLGKPKFDLTQINQLWLNRLRERAVECQKNGIWVAVQLFQGWQIESKGWAGEPWTYHPYELANNINSVDGDQNNDSEGTETHLDTAANVVLTYQEDLVERVIDTLNDLDNVIWEITNEDTGSTDNTDWQYYMINFIHTYESGKPKQHPVGMTKQYPNESDTVLTNSSAEWVSYGNRGVVGGTKVSLNDTDHIEGLTSTYNWMWIGLCNGHAGSWYMDEWDGICYGADTRSDPTYILIRNNLKYQRELLDLVDDFLGMTPQASLSTTGYCLAKNQANQAEYIVFQDGTGNFNLDLSSATGILNIRWLRCSDGSVNTGSTVAGGANRTLTPPWTGKVVAYVYH